MSTVHRILLAVTTAAVTAALVAGPAHAGPDRRPPTIGVQGDSISEFYNDKPGDPMRGWWSILAEKKRAAVKVDAIGGSGFGMRGKTCTQPSFRERLDRVRKMRADTLVLEGGRNDPHTCKDGVVGLASKREQRERIRLYFRDVRRVVKTAGTRRVYVVTVWGPKDRQRMGAVVRFTKRYAHRAGYRFKLVQLSWSETTDGVHPNYAGSVKIAKTLGPIVRVSR